MRNLTNAMLGKMDAPTMPVTTVLKIMLQIRPPTLKLLKNKRI